MIIQALPAATVNRVKKQIANREAYHMLSLGGGVQSSCLFLMNLTGEIQPRSEFAIFADTQWERKGTYEYLEYLDAQGAKHGFPPIMKVTAGNIRNDMLAEQSRYDHMPFYVETQKRGKLNRQCTGYYKISIINRDLRSIFGMKRRIQQIGFSLDEISRRNDSNFPKYISPRYPLLEQRMSRADCLSWFSHHGHPLPVKSSCVGCPFRRDTEWAEMKNSVKEEFDDAVDFGEEIRNKTLSRPKPKSNQLTMFNLPKPSYKLFIHSSVKPLRVINFGSHDSSASASAEDEECQGGCFL